MKGKTFDTRVSEITARNIRNSSVAYLFYCCICLENLHLSLILILTINIIYTSIIKPRERPIFSGWADF